MRIEFTFFNKNYDREMLESCVEDLSDDTTIKELRLIGRKKLKEYGFRNQYIAEEEVENNFDPTNPDYDRLVEEEIEYYWDGVTFYFSIIGE